MSSRQKLVRHANTALLVSWFCACLLLFELLLGPPPFWDALESLKLQEHAKIIKAEVSGFFTAVYKER